MTSLSTLARRPLFHSFDYLTVSEITRLKCSSKGMYRKTNDWFRSRSYILTQVVIPKKPSHEMMKIGIFIQNHFDLIDCNMVGPFSQNLQYVNVIFVGNEHRTLHHHQLASQLARLFLSTRQVCILTEHDEHAEVIPSQLKAPKHLLRCWDTAAADELPDTYFEEAEQLIQTCRGLMSIATENLPFLYQRFEAFKLDLKGFHTYFFPEATQKELSAFIDSFKLIKKGKKRESSATTHSRCYQGLQKLTEKALTRLKQRWNTRHRNISDHFFARNQTMIAHSIDATQQYSLALTAAGQGHLTQLSSGQNYVRGVKLIRQECFKKGVAFMSLSPKDSPEEHAKMKKVQEKWHPLPSSIKQMPAIAFGKTIMESSMLDYVGSVMRDVDSLEEPSFSEVNVVESCLHLALLTINHVLKTNPGAEWTGTVKELLPCDWEKHFETH
ncbi:MAG: hypothetical protein H0X51_00485 [Parachlamydiaceae bacterium]|nr:hypothetical protein [Parachlamydiaceae bacterium]